MRSELELKKLDPVEMGIRVRRQREFLHMTREELAGCLGVSSKFVADIEYGEKGISLKRLCLLTQILEVSADYLLAGSENGSIEQIEKEHMRASILEPLKHCNMRQLHCIEQIVKLYVEGLKER